MAKKAASSKQAKAVTVTAEPKAKPKAHTRTAKPAEVDRIERGRRLAAAYLVRRDGMDEGVAAAVIGGMEPEQIEELITEANTSTMERTAPPGGNGAGPVGAQATSVAPPADEPAPPQAEPPAATTGKAAPAPPIDFLTVPALAEDEDLVALVLKAQELANTKRRADEDCKATKALIFAKYKAAGVKLNQPVNVAGVLTTPYRGKTVTLDKGKLLLAGVDPKVIAKSYKETPYDDVRFGVAKIDIQVVG